MLDDQFIELGEISILNGLDHVPMFNNGFLDSTGRRPGIISHNMGPGAEVVNHLIKIPVVAGIKDHSVKFGINFDHLGGFAP